MMSASKKTAKRSSTIFNCKGENFATTTKFCKIRLQRYAECWQLNKENLKSRASQKWTLPWFRKRPLCQSLPEVHCFVYKKLCVIFNTQRASRARAYRNNAGEKVACIIAIYLQNTTSMCQNMGLITVMKQLCWKAKCLSARNGLESSTGVFQAYHANSDIDGRDDVNFIDKQDQMSMIWVKKCPLGPDSH